jgi:DNA-binding transcriptional MerR regulator
VSGEPLLKMSELAERSGVSAGTIKHYLREGLLGDGADIERTSRNMAYYPPAFVERIRLIKRLQEDRFMPLRVIRGVMEEGPDHAAVLLELGDRIAAAALVDRDRERLPAGEAARRHDVPANVLERLGELGVISAPGVGYDADDERIVAAIARFRAGGYDERLGFTVFDTLRYREALEPLVAEEVRTLLGRLAGEVPVRRAVEIVGAGAEPLRELIGAMHSKLLRAELERRRA